MHEEKAFSVEPDQPSQNLLSPYKQALFLALALDRLRLQITSHWDKTPKIYLAFIEESINMDGLLTILVSALFFAIGFVTAIIFSK